MRQRAATRTWPGRHSTPTRAEGDANVARQAQHANTRRRPRTVTPKPAGRCCTGLNEHSTPRAGRPGPPLSGPPYPCPPKRSTRGHAATHLAEAAQRRHADPRSIPHFSRPAPSQIHKRPRRRDAPRGGSPAPPRGPAPARPRPAPRPPAPARCRRPAPANGPPARPLRTLCRAPAGGPAAAPPRCQTCSGAASGGVRLRHDSVTAAAKR